MISIREHPQIKLETNVSQKRRDPIRDAYEKVAESYESQFINHMLTEMKKSVQKEEQETMAEEYYNSLLDSERSDLMAKQGLGIKEMILKQIYPQYFEKNNQREGQSAISKKETINE